MHPKHILQRKAHGSSDIRSSVWKRSNGQVKGDQLSMWRVGESWNAIVYGNPMWRLQQKLKNLAFKLSTWSRQQVGDVYQKTEEWEATLQELEENDIIQNSDASREEVNKAHAEYIRWMGIQEALMKQKAQAQWFEEGDCNTRYFHNCVKDRRRRMQLHRIKNARGQWVQGDEQILDTAIRHFKKQFNLPASTVDLSLMDLIPQVITEEDNIMLDAMPNEEEIRDATMQMSATSSPGPDGFNGTFYHRCWHIIKAEVVAFVQSCFSGKKLTRYFSHTGLVLIPKVESPDNFGDLRPISLSNFSAKIVSKILALRLNSVLDKLISEEQSGFVKGRSIIDNVLLAQEIIQNISNKNRGGNIVLKLDMAKAYDRLSWPFLIAVLQKFGFSEFWLNMIWNLISNVWYSITINGCRGGFFTSSQGVKQGDPLSPSLFIIAAEVLSRLLKALLLNEQFTPFSMNPNGPLINHLAYADDIVIFSSGRNASIKLIMTQIQRYEKSSGQLVNAQKSFFCTLPNVSSVRINRIIHCSGFRHKSFPFTYLGCPLYIGRKQPVYFDELVNKITNRISGWHSKCLSFGGKVTLIKHVLQSVPIYTFSALNPPKSILLLIEKHLTRFFWGTTNEKIKYHWSSWQNMAFPKNEGGIGLKRMSDICDSFTFKRWWKFRTCKTLWSDFLRAKYCSRMHPVAKTNASKQSHAWGSMLKIRKKAEENMCWCIQSGDVSMWWDNWLGEGALAITTQSRSAADKTRVKDFIQDEEWDEEKLLEQLDQEIVQQILKIPVGKVHHHDFATWKPGHNGVFSTKSVIHCISSHRSTSNILSKVWHKHLPFKISFLSWRLIQKKLPFDDVLLNRFGFDNTSMCLCCQNSSCETMIHTFLNGEAATHLWKHFGGPLGITSTHGSIENCFWNWWSVKAKNLVQKLILNITPIVICWEIWRNRCACKYGDQKRMWLNGMKFQIMWNIKAVLKLSFPNILAGVTWLEICDQVDKLKHLQTSRLIKWQKPRHGRKKMNTDGSYKDGSAGVGGILRDGDGQMVMAFSMPIKTDSCNHAEAYAAKTGLTWCSQNGIADIDLEIDSLMVVNMLKKGNTKNLKMKPIIDEILELKTQLNCEIHHCFREANGVADILAKDGAEMETPLIFTSWNQLPRGAKGIFQLDKAQIPSVRIRFDKANFHVS